PDVGLHPDPPSVDPVDREGRHAGEHQAPPSAAAPTGAQVGPATSAAAACRRPLGETWGVIAPAVRRTTGAIGEEERSATIRLSPPGCGTAIGRSGAGE